MPKGSTQTRLNNIRKEGATATIEECNYDECVRMAADMAARTEHGIIVQDTAWDGYEEIPAWIMQGYGTMAMEADDQLHEDGCEARLMYLSGWCRIPLPVLFRDILRTAIPRPRRKWSLWKPKRLPAFTKELLPETVRSAL